MIKLEDFFNSAWNKIIDWIKDPWILVLFFLVTSLMIFLPEKYLSLLKINGLANEHGWIIGMIFMVTGISLIIFMILKIIYWVNKKLYFFDKKNRLKNLTVGEKKVLGRFISFQERTISFNLIQNNKIKELANQGLVRYTAREGDMFEYPFTIKEWVYKYLNKNKHLVELTEEELESMKNRKDQVRQDIRNR